MPGGTGKTLGSYVCAFVTNEFAQEITTPPFFWIGERLVSRVLTGTNPVLNDAQVRECNSAEGLNLIIWPSAPAAEAENRVDVRQASQTAFFEAYRGYLLKRLNAQASSPMEITMALNSGGWCLQSQDGTQIQKLDEPAETFVSRPHMLQVTREDAMKQMGTWVSHFFYYRKPILGFPRSEQRVLRLALEGHTDAELSAELGISLSAIKKAWNSIYRRVVEREVIPSKDFSETQPEGDRGREKKRKLLAYLRDHPEELRPVSLKLIGK
jgi:DNA-binding NarL/FixJ family response regulator